MQRGNKPLARGGRLVLVEAQADGPPHARERAAEREVRGRVVDRVGIEDDQRVDGAGAHLLGERRERHR